MILAGSSSVRLFPESYIYWKGCLRSGGEKKASHFKSLEVSKKKKKTKQKTKTKNKNNKKTIPISHHHQQKKQTNKKHPTNCNNQEEITVKSNYNKSTHRSTLQYQLLEDSRKY